MRRQRQSLLLDRVDIPAASLDVMKDEVLGLGGFGTVYLADLGGGLNAAAKVVRFGNKPVGRGSNDVREPERERGGGDDDDDDHEEKSDSIVTTTATIDDDDNDADNDVDKDDSNGAGQQRQAAGEGSVELASAGQGAAGAAVGAWDTAAAAAGADGYDDSSIPTGLSLIRGIPGREPRGGRGAGAGGGEQRPPRGQRGTEEQEAAAAAGQAETDPFSEPPIDQKARRRAVVAKAKRAASKQRLLARERSALCRELEAMKRLRGPNTVHTYGAVTALGRNRVRTYVNCVGYVRAARNLWFSYDRVGAS